jgi:signal transduction histidine kinase
MEDAISTDQIYTVVLFGILIMTAMALALVAYFNYSSKKILVAERESQLIKLKYQDNLIENNFKVQETERKRIAEDLHDEIGSKLNVINLYLHQLKKSIPSNDDNNELLEEMDQTLSSTIEVSRNIAHELLPPTLDNFGLFPAITELVQTINTSGQILISLTLNVKSDKLKNKWAEINTFRVIQEMLTNSIKYCKNDAKVQIDIEQDENDRYIWNYKDNGPGYDIESEANKKGLGMGNINSRLKMIDAQLINNSKVGSGAQYLITYNDHT